MLPFAILAAVFIALLYWEIWVCEGAHLGRRFVVWLYQLLADRYESIKQFDPEWERHVLGEPLASSLAHLGRARVLDVGAGSARLARALIPVARGDLKLVAAEPSPRMLALGQSLAPSAFPWLRAWADALPFPGGLFDVVAALEVLEFTPDPGASLREMIRVLRPGGLLLVSNRVGPEAPWIFGRTVPRSRLDEYLAGFGLNDIRILPWQVEYDLASASKA